MDFSAAACETWVPTTNTFRRSHSLPRCHRKHRTSSNNMGDTFLDTWEQSAPSYNFQQQMKAHLTPPASEGRTPIYLSDGSSNGDSASLIRIGSESSESTTTPPPRIPSQKEVQKSTRYYCQVSDCRNKTGFQREKDLKRHEKKHDDESPLYYCGCCQLQGENFQGLERKDKVQKHMDNKHQMESSSEARGLMCTEEDCHLEKRLLFTTQSCLAEHVRQYHPTSTASLGEKPTSGECRER